MIVLFPETPARAESRPHVEKQDMDDAQPLFGSPIGRWHRWFAWKPVVTFDGRWTWLRRIERRRIQLHDWLTGGPDQWWQYRRHDQYI